MSVAYSPLHALSLVTSQTFLSSALPLAHPTPGTSVHLLVLKYCLSKGPDLTGLVNIATHSQSLPLSLLYYFT